MAQIRIMGPVLYGVIGGRCVEVERINAAIATAVLEVLGHSSAVAVLIAHHALDSAAARQLGMQLGLLREEVIDTEVG